MAPKSRAVQPDFVFLPYAPNQNRKSQAIQDTQRRAHAARKSHATARQRRAVPETSSSDDPSSSTSPESPSNQQLETVGSNETLVGKSAEIVEEMHTILLNDDSGDDDGPQPVASNDQLQIWTSRKVSPNSRFLGQGNVDPFDAFAAKGLPPYVFKVLDIAADMKWGHLKPSVLHQRSNPLKRAWLRANMESPAVLHAMVYGMLVSLESIQSPLEPGNTLSLKHQTFAMNLLQKELRTLGDDTPHQNLLLAVITLAAHGEPVRGQYVPPLGYPESPMAKTQNLHIYGQMRLAPEHTHAIFMILERVGGIEAVTIYGLRDTLEFCDLYFATRFGTSPRLPYRHPFYPLIPDIEYVPDSKAEHLLLTSVRSLVTLPALAFSESYMEVIGMSCVLLAGLDQYLRETESAPSLPSLVRARSAFQHRLTSLRPINMTIAVYDEQIREICRVTLLLFSNMVFFPLPHVSGVNTRLVASLRHSISITGDEFPLQNLEMMTWVLMIGGIAAFPTEHRSWFAATFRKNLLWHANDWKEVEGILEAHLWWDYVCEDAGRIFWKEVHSAHRSAPLAGEEIILPFYGPP